MSLQSMTGFGKSEALFDNFALNIEVKSVNHRFKDLRFKIPGFLNFLELELRRKVEQKFKRGSFDIFITIKKMANYESFNEIDEKKVADFIRFAQRITVIEKISLHIDPVIFLKAEFQRETGDEEAKKWSDILLSTFDEALNSLEITRKQEGEQIRTVILAYQGELQKKIKLITSAADLYRQDIAEKLQKRLQELDTAINIDDGRFLQEIVYYLEKLDVEEELNRLQSHLEKLASYLQETSEIGRKVDFLLQELNRETNTIGAKAQKTEITEAVVDIKVILEKIREQALNIE